MVKKKPTGFEEFYKKTNNLDILKTIKDSDNNDDADIRNFLDSEKLRLEKILALLRHPAETILNNKHLDKLIEDAEKRNELLEEEFVNYQLGRETKFWKSVKLTFNGAFAVQ